MIVTVALLTVFAFAGTTGPDAVTDEERDAAKRELTELYGEVSVNTMTWSLNPRQPDQLRLFLQAGIPATSTIRIGEGEDAFDLGLINYTLQFACEGAKTAEVVQILVDAGADPGAPSPGTGNTPLMQAVECPLVIDVLLRAGADPNYRSPRGDTPLTWALMWRGGDETIRLLLEAGADIRPDKDRIPELLRYGDLSQTTRKRIEDALSKPDPADMKPWAVRKAIGDRQVRVVEEYLDAKPDSVTRIGDDPSLLVVTSRCRKDEDPAAAVAMIKAFIERGSDVNAADEITKETPLHSAAGACPAEVVRLLVDAGAAIEAKNLADQTPLFLAVFSDNPGAVEVLLDAGAKVDHNTKFFANSKPHLKELLKKRR